MDGVKAKRASVTQGGAWCTTELVLVEKMMCTQENKRGTTAWVAADTVEGMKKDYPNHDKVLYTKVL